MTAATHIARCAKTLAIAATAALGVQIADAAAYTMGHSQAVSPFAGSPFAPQPAPQTQGDVKSHLLVEHGDWAVRLVKRPGAAMCVVGAEFLDGTDLMVKYSTERDTPFIHLFNQNWAGVDSRMKTRVAMTFETPNHAYDVSLMGLDDTQEPGVDIEIPAEALIHLHDSHAVRFDLPNGDEIGYYELDQNSAYALKDFIKCVAEVARHVSNQAAPSPQAGADRGARGRNPFASY